MSTCVKRAVGAVLVIDNHQLCSGFNGVPKGAVHRTVDTCVRIGIASGACADLVCCCHAETNVINIAARRGIKTDGASMYVTVHPCAGCARNIINAGIVRVFYEGDYSDDRDAAAKSVFAESKIPCERLVKD